MLCLPANMLHETLNGKHPGAPLMKPRNMISLDTLPEYFWHKYLDGAGKAVYPQIPVSVHKVQRSARVEHCIDLGNEEACKRLNSLLPSVIQTAWALLLWKYTESQDVVIASTIHSPGQHFPEAPVLPIRFALSDKMKARHLAWHAKDLARAAGSPGKSLPQYAADVTKMVANSVLIIKTDSLKHQPLQPALAGGEALRGCALLLYCGLSGCQIQARAFFDPRVIHVRQARRILHQMDHIIQQLSKSENVLVDQVSFVSPQDHQDIAAVNLGAGPRDLCIHELISEQVQAYPNAQAVNCHDGDLTYGELDALATTLATHLNHLGVGRGSFVPTLFEKSKWTQVAVLAILKAGAAFVMLDPAHPAHRNQLISQKVRASVALASPGFEHVLAVAVPDVLALTEDLISSISTGEATVTPISPPDPRSCAYVLFTSGSTGTPKGAVLEHRSFAAAARGIMRTTRMSPQTRTLQFASYSFGAAVVEIITTFIAGGCVCVLSDEQRLSGDLPAFITTSRANWAFMTPSLARTMGPATVPSLKVLVTGGEVITPDLLHAWAPRLDLYAVYGSAEQSSISAMTGPLVPGQADGGAGFGRPFEGNYMWVVDPDNPQRLVPFGCVGELILEGPTVARGYLDDPEKTAVAFPEGFSWRNGFAKHPGGTMRFYKTGDLVRYGFDGTLQFVARKDGYVKLRGQRIELGEIEFQLKRAMKSPLDVCVEVVVPNQGKDTDQAALVAFVALGEKYEGDGDADDSDKGLTMPTLQNKKLLADHLRSAQESLASELPEHMVPRFFFPLRKMPLTMSGKTLRGVLREWGGRLSVKQLGELSLTRAENARAEPSSKMEKHLQSLWSQLLGIPASSISAGDSFTEIGGDSLKVMKLFTRLRDSGYEIDVRGLLAAPILSEMALKCHQVVHAYDDWSNDYD